MTDYTELIRQLKTYEDGYGLYDDAADAIEALDAKADYWMGQAQEEYEKRLRQMPNRGEIVRCGECKHHEDEEPGMVYCPKIVGSWVSENWYCADGEREVQE